MNVKAAPYLFCAPFIIGYTVLSLFPILYTFFISLHDWNGIAPKVFIGFKNYISILTQDKLFYKSLVNTIVMMLMAMPFQLLFGLILAQIVFNLKKGRSFFQITSFLPFITAPVAVGFIFAYLFDWNLGYINVALKSLGMINEGVYWLQIPLASKLVVALMKIWKLTGYCMIIYIAGMTAISPEIYEAASVDGSSRLNTFIKITIPMLKHITLFLFVTSVISSLQLFDEAALLYSGWGAAQSVGGPEYAVLTVVWKFYDDAFKTNSMLGYGAAESYLLFITIIAMSLASYRIFNGKEKT
ncbi:carbohydrate ABC transporter permease [Paenibacillus thalictri]|uniref:Sugar ABC transporter permease n=1 Tax=Paenibacillus thalictri TaxID=2527873 RepID=A0A4Q9E1Q1_9BACL|nr:sugar ABC transporter permease [Paenibacillus thalictri]TBL81511.1 sugar ABC transporter permease [Paenibacillus thalictri]